MGLNKALFSSKSKEWETPDDLFNALDEIFHFDLDVCATKDNTKCGQFFSPEDDGLKQTWKSKTCWMNPPYGRKVGEWIHKAFWEAHEHNITVVGLLPARTDTRWWHDWVMRAQQIWFIKGRVYFLNENKVSDRAPFPSCVVIWMGATQTKTPTIRTYILPP